MYVAEYIDPTFESLSPANTARRLVDYGGTRHRVLASGP